MSEVFYEAAEYGDGNDQAVALVAGFDGGIDQLDQAARDLASNGHDAVVYAYDKEILLKGDGRLLLDSATALSNDFVRRTSDHASRRFAGVSLGAAIAAGMQKAESTPAPGLYAASGIDAAKLVMRNPMFRAMVRAVHGVDIRRAYERHGYTLADLQEEWQELQAPPITPFAVVLGGLDYIVRNREILPKIKAWQAENNIRVLHKPWLGHNGTIRWFGANILSVLNPEPPAEAAITVAHLPLALPIQKLQTDLPGL